MLLTLSSDQEFFRDTTRRFLDEKVPVAELRRRRDDPAGYAEAYWRAGAELGWTSLLVSEAHGGGSISGLGLVDLTLVAHEFGAHAAPGPLLGTNLVAHALSAADSHTDVLAELLAGTAVAGWAFGEPPPGDHLGELHLEVAVDGDELVLDGIKRPVESASQARWLLVTGRTTTPGGTGTTQVLVPTDTPGVTCSSLRTVDLTRRFDAVTFEGVRVPRSAAVGPVGSAAPAVASQVRVASVLLAAEMVGAMQTGFDLTVEWAFDRYSFGRPLASYQALKHRFADMKAWLEASHAITDAAATALAEQLVATDADRVASDPAVGELASAAKAYVSQYGAELMADCVQLHGGIGVTYEHDLHLYLRRVTLDRGLVGTAHDHRLRVAELARQREEAAA